MKKSLRTLTLLSALLVGAATLAAQPAIKLVVVDMARVFDNHYKKEEADVKFRDAEQKAQEQIEELNKQGNALVEEYKELVEQSKNAVLTEKARADAEANAQKKFAEIQQKQNDVQNFRVNARNSLQQRIKTHRDLLLEEISKVVVDLAKKKSATLVMDKSGPTLFGISSVLHADAAYDITDEVMTEVNKDRPPASAAAPAATTPAATTPAAAPAATPPLFTAPAPKKQP